MSRLVAVSNRISIPRKGAAPGGLAVGVLAAMQARGGLWFGWSGEVVDGAPRETRISSRGGIGFATIDLPREDHDLHYLGFCNGALWPLFHYFVDKFQFVDAQYAAYQRVNRLFADRLRPLLRNDDLVWVHDYHLIPLGQMLRTAGAQQRLGFFLHVPFPHIEVLRTLPVYGALMRALLAYDTIGFQTSRDLDSFFSGVRELWGPGAIGSDGVITAAGSRTHALVNPIGVDVDATGHLDIEHRLRQAAHARGEIAQAPPALAHDRQHLQRRDQAVARGRLVEADHVPRSLAAENAVVLLQHGEHLPVANPGPAELHTELPERELEAEIAHDGAHDRATERLPPQAVGGEDIEESVAVDDSSALVDHDDAVAVAVERDADVRAHARDRERKGHGAQRRRDRPRPL